MLNTYAVDIKTHETVWTYPQAGKLAISQDNKLFITGLDGSVHAIALPQNEK